MTIRSLRIRNSSSSNSRWVSSIWRSPRVTSRASGLSWRAAHTSEAEPPGGPGGRGAGGPAPEGLPQAREQLLALERCDQVVIGAAGEAVSPDLDGTALG